MKRSTVIRRQLTIFTLFYTCLKARSQLALSFASSLAACFQVLYPDELSPACAGTSTLTQFVQKNDGLVVSNCCISRKLHFRIHYKVEKLPVLCVLHHHENTVRRLNYFIQLCDRGVSDQFQNMQLS